MNNITNKDSYFDTLVQRIAEPNIRVALVWANQLYSTQLKLPDSLSDVNMRAKIVNLLDSNFGIIQRVYDADDNTREDYIKLMAELSSAYMPDVQEDIKRVSIIFILWAGCLSAAKTIALETRSGPNTPMIRKQFFDELINPLADLDAIYLAGVEAAKEFKDLRHEPYSFEGIPINTPIII